MSDKAQPQVVVLGTAMKQGSLSAVDGTRRRMARKTRDLVLALEKTVEEVESYCEVVENGNSLV